MKTQTASSKKQMTIPACPACSHMKGRELKPFVYECGACSGIFSDHIYLGESYELVKPFVSPEPDVPQERMRYFDFTCLGPKGITRRHGWFDTATKLIVQVG
jgi:hypothetical protein